jgi:hypothetical protein
LIQPLCMNPKNSHFCYDRKWFEISASDFLYSRFSLHLTGPAVRTFTFWGVLDVHLDPSDCFHAEPRGSIAFYRYDGCMDRQLHDFHKVAAGRGRARHSLALARIHLPVFRAPFFRPILSMGGRYCSYSFIEISSAPA